MLLVKDSDGEFVKEWHLGEFIPDMGRVVTIRVDGDELNLLMQAMWLTANTLDGITYSKRQGFYIYKGENMSVEAHPNINAAGFTQAIISAFYKYLRGPATVEPGSVHVAGDILHNEVVDFVVKVSEKLDKKFGG